MHIGPSTPNLDLAEMLDMVAEKLRDQLSADQYAALIEAATRIEERGDEEND